MTDPCLYCEDGPVGGKCDLLPARPDCLSHTPEEQLFRINHEIFLRDEVERYEESMGFRRGNDVSPAETDHGLQMDLSVNSERNLTAAQYVALRKKEGSIPDGQIMLEVQDRWGRAPNKVMTRAEIAALVLGRDMPLVDDIDMKSSLENAFKDRVKRFTRGQSKNN